MSSSSDSAPGEEPALGSSDSGRSTTGDQTQDIGSAVDRARAVVTECTRHQADGEFLLYRKTFVAASDPSTDKDADTAQPATQSAWARAKEHLRAEWASHRHSDPMLLVETESADEGREHHKKDGTIDGIVIQLADPRIASAFIVHGWTHTTKSKPRDRAATKGAKVLADALAHAWGVNPNFIHYAGRLGSKGERDMIGAIFIADRASPRTRTTRVAQPGSSSQAPRGCLCLRGSTTSTRCCTQRICPARSHCPPVCTTRPQRPTTAPDPTATPHSCGSGSAPCACACAGRTCGPTTRGPPRDHCHTARVPCVR